MEGLYLIALRLRALSHIMKQTDYILMVTDDEDYPMTLINLVCDNLEQISEDLQKVSDKMENQVKGLSTYLEETKEI